MTQHDAKDRLEGILRQIGFGGDVGELADELVMRNVVVHTGAYRASVDGMFAMWPVLLELLQKLREDPSCQTRPWIDELRILIDGANSIAEELRKTQVGGMLLLNNVDRSLEN